MKNRILALSFQSVAELWHWAETRGWGEQARNDLDVFLRRFLIIPWDHELARIWARVMQKSSQIGRRLKDFLDLSIPGLDVISYAERRPTREQRGSDQ